MKRIAVLIIMTISAMYTYAQHRQQVTRDEAVRVALTRLNVPSDHVPQNARISEKRDSTGNIILYEVTTDSLSVLLSGSKACYPLLGKYHTPNGSLLDNYDNLPDNVRWLIDSYIAQIAPCFRNDTIHLYYNDEWNNLIDGINLSNTRNLEIGPLMTTKWMQNGCNIGNDIGYEFELPSSSINCYYYQVGCGAVAMGQVLNYWKHPVSPSWEESYDWCNMSDILDTSSPTFLMNRKAISHLLSDCGHAIPTNYDCVQSISDFNRIPAALINFFKYNPNAHIVRREDHPNEWTNILIGQINSGFPVIYSGNSGSIGHTFVCDGYGYDNLNNFFIYANYGNGHNYDGWYRLDEIHMGELPLTHYQSAIIDIYPRNYTVLCNRDVVLDDYYNLYQDVITSGTYQPWEILPVTVTNLTSASTDTPLSWRTIPDGATTTYQAQESITLRDGFTVEREADFAAIIEPCDNCGNPPLILPSECSELQQMEQTTEESLEDGKGKPKHSTVQREQIPLFTLTPNPAHNSVTVTVNPQLSTLNSQLSITLTDAAGRELYSTKISILNSQISILNYPAGTYFVTLRTPDTASTQRLVIE